MTFLIWFLVLNAISIPVALIAFGSIWHKKDDFEY